MRIFIAGATGVLGRRVVQRLVAAGHQVVGASRSTTNQELLRRLGAEPRECDILDPAAATRASAGCAIIMHLATAIPDEGRRRSAWRTNDAIRTDGTQALTRAARENGARLYIQQSVTFVLGDRDGRWVDETSAPAERVGSIIDSAVTMESIVTAAGVPAAILRCGAFYGADSVQTKRLVLGTRAGKVRWIGRGDTWWNLLHIDDAAAAFAASVALGGGGTQVLHVVDDEPVTMRALVEHLAQRLGVKPPGGVPRVAARLYLGKPIYDTLSASVRVGNARARQLLAWWPQYPSYREGYAQVLPDILGREGA